MLQETTSRLTTTIGRLTLSNPVICGSGEPVMTEGPVLRTWSKGRIAIFGRVHYLLLERRVFEVNAATALEIAAGDHVRVEHWPHTNTVISVHRIPRETGPTARTP